MELAEAFRLDGKVALVTGAGSGIGEACATVLAAAGARVVATDVDRAAVERVAKEIAAAGGDASAAELDVSDGDAVDAVVADVAATAGRLDVLVNNAGVMRRRPLLEVSAEEFTRVLSINLVGVLRCTQAAARVMGPGSAVVNTLSSIIDYSTAGTGSYAAAKKGVEALTRTFAIELGPRGIRVNGIAPGWTRTGMTRGATTDGAGTFDEADYDALAGRMAAVSPLGDIAEPADSAHAVLYLASPAGRFVTGHVVRVNGGASMV